MERITSPVLAYPRGYTEFSDHKMSNIPPYLVFFFLAFISCAVTFCCLRFCIWVCFEARDSRSRRRRHGTLHSKQAKFDLFSVAIGRYIYRYLANQMGFLAQIRLARNSFCRVLSFNSPFKWFDCVFFSGGYWHNGFFYFLCGAVLYLLPDHAHGLFRSSGICPPHFWT